MNGIRENQMESSLVNRPSVVKLFKHFQGFFYGFFNMGVEKCSVELLCLLAYLGQFIA